MRWLGTLVILCLCGSTAAAQTIPSFCSQYPQTEGPGDWHASRVFYQNGRLTYISDSQGNRIPDYSYAGYGYGAKPIPSIPTVTTLSPATGDQTSRINSALASVSSPGAVMLGAGTWEVRGTIVLNRSGVVLRGAGNSTSGTVLRATGDTPHQRPVIRMGSGTGTWTTSGTTNITDSLVPVNATSFNVASTTGLAVGDNIRIFHPSTSAWINAVDGGGTVNDPSWTAGQIDIEYIRRITAISGTRLTVDAPIYNHLNRSLSQSTVSRITNINAIREAGVESLRIDIVTASSTDENHAWNGVDVIGAHDSWVRGVTALHFGSAGVVLENARHVTVENCEALDPHGVRTGGRFYNFNNERRSQNNLFRNCRATLGRHGYISNGVSASSGIVYTRSAQQGGGSEGGHRMWVQGVLYDNIDELSSGQVLLINRGDFGSSHGWACAHCTVWKYDGETLAQKPPTAQNYAFNVAGTFRSSVYFPGPFGVQERQSGRLVPESLYEAQLCERLEGGQPPTPTPTPTQTPIVTPTPTPTQPPTGEFTEITPPASAVTASTSDANVPGNTVDNNLATRWSGNGDGAWLQFDLGSVRTVAFVNVAAYQGNMRRNRFDIQVATTLGQWTTVRAAAETSGTTTQEETFDFEDVDARWVRYLGHGNIGSSNTSMNSVTEVSLFTPNTPTVTPTPTATPTAVLTPTPTPTPTTPTGPVELTPGGAAVSASTNDGNVPANTVDDNLATRWSGNGDGAWIQYDLGATRTVTSVVIAWYQGNTRVSTFDVLASSSPTGPWTTLAAGRQSSGTTTALETYDVTDGSGRYVRIVGHGNTLSGWNSLTEVQIWGVP